MSGRRGAGVRAAAGREPEAEAEPECRERGGCGGEEQTPSLSALGEVAAVYTYITACTYIRNCGVRLG